ncbi:MAG: DUF4442 domain-containing protein [Gammaproteobacteria bacterium]|nr:DUF4442 domain-containing protein [Gammaproteobacteria bacterium]
MNKTLRIYQQLEKFPLGKRLFSWQVGRVAPYFSSVSPLVTQLEKNYCSILIKRQRKVFNHIKTMHVIAICNGLEMAMGVMAEASIPKNLRWIPKGMTVNYTAKAASDIRCIAKVNESDWKVGDMIVPVKAIDENDIEVVVGEIKLWITERKS